MTPQSPQVESSADTDALLWNDEAILFDRHNKTAASLVAMQRALAKHLATEPGVSEFLQLFDRLTALPAEHFTRVWREPSAYYWVRVTYQVLGQVLNPVSGANPMEKIIAQTGDGDPLRALQFQLHRFKHFVLGACYLAGEDLSLETPLEVDLPCALLGTPLYLAGQGKVTVQGLESGSLHLELAGQALQLPLHAGAGPLAGVSVETCPVIEHGDGVYCMQPFSLDLPGVDFVKPALAAGIDYQQKHCDLVISTLDVLQQFAPSVYAQFSAFMHGIVLKPLDAGSYSNLSHSDFPGTAVVGFYNNPWMLADAFIHEFHHNRLFCIEEAGAFFEDPDHLEDTSHYSPWRYDLRPLHGVYHAVYVHLPVGEYWLQLLTADDPQLQPETLAFARDRLMRIVLQNRIAIGQLETRGRLTEAGTRILLALKARSGNLQRQARAAGVGLDTPARICRLDGTIGAEQSVDGDTLPTVLASVLDHVRRYDKEGQCSFLQQDSLFAD